MPSNRELRSEIEALSEELGVSVSTSGLSNAKLTDLLEDLKAKREQPRLSSLTRGPSAPPAPAPSAPPVVEDKVEEKPPVPSPDPPVKDPDPSASDPEPVNGSLELGGPPAPKPRQQSTRTYPYTIADGKACTSLRGTLTAGAQAKAEYFSGGQKTLDHLVAKGIVIQR